MSEGGGGGLSRLADQAEARAVGRIVVEYTGKVVAYNRDKFTADVQLLVQIPMDVDGELRDVTAPVLKGLPVVWPRGGGVVFCWELAEGDLVEVCMRDRSHAEVNQGRTEPGASSRRRFNWRDAVVRVGFTPPSEGSPEGAAAADVVMLMLPGTHTFRVGVSVNASNRGLALGDLVLSELQALAGHTHGPGITPAGFTAPQGGGPVTGTSGPASYTAPSTVSSTRVLTDE